MSELVQRSLSLDVFAPDECRQSVLNSIRRYRASCRQLFAVYLLSQQAGSTIRDDGDSLRVIPNGQAAKACLEAAMGKAGKAAAYELRDWFRAELYPGSMSFVWDSARRDVQTIWSSGDPEFPRASRGYLALNGARNLAQFQRRGIGFPVVTARPKLNGHTLLLNWDHNIGPVELSLPRLDGGRYHVWRALRDGEPEWRLGTVFLNERDGKLSTTISYSRPAREQAVDAGRVCEVRFGEDAENYLRIVGPDGAATYDVISAAECTAWLRRMFARRQELERRRAACGNPRRPWGHRKGWLAAQDVLSRATAQREAGSKDRNHAWTRRIVTRAVAWRCGVVQMPPSPDTLLGQPWGWAQFEQYLRYKCAEAGITLSEASSEPEPVRDDRQPSA